MQPISFILPSRNNLKYLKQAYKSIRENLSLVHEICVADDASKDDTWNWLLELVKQDSQVKILRNESKQRVGHTILYDRLIKEKATNNIAMIFHADMVAAPKLDENILKHMNKENHTVVSATRIEPPLHPPGPEKIIEDFGIEPENFKREKFSNYVYSIMEEFQGITTTGIFAPWAIFVDDFLNVGGHDELFAPQSKEDSDIFNKFKLKEYQLIQSRDSFVYHMTCRGSRFKDGIGKNSAEWEQTNYKGERNFIRKWGSMVQHDQYMDPIIAPKYQIQLHLDCADGLSAQDFKEVLRLVEPWVTQVIIHDPKRLYAEIITEYKATEQQITLYDLNTRILYNDDSDIDEMDIVLYSTPRIISSDGFVFIQLLNKIIDSSITELGVFEYNNNRIKVNALRNDRYLDSQPRISV